MDRRCECVGIVSGKGGTGKTSFAAGAGAALSQLGRRVLCVDCDIGLRNLDLALGLADQALMDFTDVAAGRCGLEEAVVEHPALPGLFLLNAPARGSGEDVSEEQMRELMKAVRQSFDYCLLDAPAGLGQGFTLATCAASRAVVIAGLDPPSLRDAQRTVMELARFPEGAVHLVVNRVRKRLLNHLRTTVDDAMDAAGLPLLGLVPEDDALPAAMARGLPAALASPKSPAAAAYRNIAQRMEGGTAPLLRMRW